MYDRKQIKEQLLATHIPSRVYIKTSTMNPRIRGDVFLMSIENVKKEERFCICLGPQDNDIQILASDATRRQVVLGVHEPARTFTVQTWNRFIRKYEMVPQVTPVMQRYFLVGFDETHLFIARIPKEARSIEEAHSILQPHEIKVRKEYRRQGEWFFVLVSDRLIRDVINIPTPCKSHALIDPRARRRPHAAEKLLRIKGIVYVSGQITHPDHRTLNLIGWYRVYRNTELPNVDPRLSWID